MRSDEQDPGIELMLAYQAGDEGAFDRLVETYSGRVYALLTRFLGRVPSREDLVQEVFLRVIRARRSYRPSARFSTWLYRIVFNLSANERQRQGARSLETESAGEAPEGSAAWPDDAAAPPSEALEREDLVRAVRDAIALLPDQQRMALILAKYEDQSYAEVAEVLGSSEQAIKSMIHRARENLRATLAPFLQEELA